ncbi:MAG: NERD domain-containing protein [Anaerolineae bacterium]|nr:NERD domain-containing protein [Anaerolineae bacterium]
MDEGFLNESRLAWAAEKAYNPQLKQAAGLLLDALRQRPVDPPIAASAVDARPATVAAIQAPITVAQAQATLWPFAPFKGQSMGALVAARQITLKDLAYAVEQAWDERVQQAAIVLLAVRLNQVVAEPPPPAGPLKVVTSGESYSMRRRLAWTLAQGMFVGAGGILIPVLLIRSIKSALARPLPPNPFESPATLIGAILALGLLLVGIWAVNRLIGGADKKFEREIENARKGHEGEERMVDSLRQHLDGNWVLFRNVVLPGYKADMDAVLVGPPGVWVLEVKNFTGNYINSGTRWGYVRGKRRKEIKPGPSRQAQRNAAQLSSFLKADGIKQFVNPVVVWANQESRVKVKQPVVPVWTLDHLPDELGNLWQDRPLDANTQTRIVEKLTALCERAARRQDTR